MEAFTSQKVEVISKKENFEGFETSDIYANKSKDELYQELIALGVRNMQLRGLERYENQA
jgi:Ran GTPase-activating protein (RanGAP) involved in mRNA processing and transport